MLLQNWEKKKPEPARKSTEKVNRCHVDGVDGGDDGTGLLGLIRHPGKIKVYI